MPRIRTDQPSSGRPLQLLISAGGFVPATFTTLAEAPDFSVPSTGNDGTVDPAASDRELRPGEVFIETPLACTNTDTAARWVELQILTAGGHAVPVTPQVAIPPKETLYLPIQGLRLLKTDFAAANGDRLQIRASTNAAIKIFGSASELEAQSHAPDTEA
jgi:hypothetical protein